MKVLERNKTLFSVWAFAAAFGTYFCMYAYRKPFNAATYTDLYFLGLELKDVLVISQVLGYMLSKVIGVKVISELKAANRVKLVLSLILFSYVSLFLFAISPPNMGMVFLFCNGLPLGMVWGIVFSFLEGRRLTELIATGISIGAIISSGYVKSIGQYLIQSEYFQVDEFWMPFVVGTVFLPFLMFFVWMLTKIPKPNEEDNSLKSKREPMVSSDRTGMLKKYGLGLAFLILAYVLLTIFRDFRDNYAVEIWKSLGNKDVSVYLRTETIIAICVTCTTALLVLFKDNFKGFTACLFFSFLGFSLMGGSTWLFDRSIVGPFYWIVCSGLGLYMAYVPFQVVLYERLIPLFNMKGNAGFLMYMADSTGYLASVFILLYKNFSNDFPDWYEFLMALGYVCSGLGLFLLFLAFFYFSFKLNKQRNINIQRNESYN